MIGSRQRKQSYNAQQIHTEPIADTSHKKKYATLYKLYRISVYSCKFCSCCAVLIFVIAYLILYYSHHVTCSFYLSLCSPLHHIAKRMISPTDALTDMSYKQKMDQSWTDDHKQNKCEQFEKLNIDGSNVKFGILLGQRHGGTNYFMDELNKYSQITMEREMLINWEHEKCSTYATMIEQTDCNEQSLIDELDSIYNNFLNRQRNKSDGKGRFFFWKVQMSQIPTHLYNTFVDYIYCHNIIVIQLIREASIASFWSWQAETLERVQSGNVNAMVDRKYTVNHVDTLSLDPYQSQKYVINTDTNREHLRKMIKLYPFPIKHQQFDYEDLIGTYSESYWNAIIAFIGIDTRAKNHGKTSRTREHSMACHERIENWDEIKPLLNGTSSYFACEKAFS